MKNDRSFTTILRELAEGSSLHGIPKTVSSKQLPVKVLWCLLFIGTCTVFGLQLYNLFSAYYSYPIQTGVSLKFSALRYPAVTFCNMNPVKLSQINSYPTLKEVINPKRVGIILLIQNTVKFHYSDAISKKKKKKRYLKKKQKKKNKLFTKKYNPDTFPVLFRFHFR